MELDFKTIYYRIDRPILSCHNIDYGFSIFIIIIDFGDISVLNRIHKSFIILLTQEPSVIRVLNMALEHCNTLEITVTEGVVASTCDVIDLN